jgi:hypothetical protein
MTPISEMTDFLDIAVKQGFLNDNTVAARRTAVNKFAEILDPENRTVEYLRDNLDVVKARFSNLNKEVRGNTVDEYARRVVLVLDDFTEWKADRAGWERKVSAKASRPAGDGEKIVKLKTEKKTETKDSGSTPPPNPSVRVLTLPMRSDFEVEIKVPREGLTRQELRKLVYFLLPYAPDFEPDESPRNVFPMLDREGRG